MNKKSNKVIVYSTPTCPYCIYAKDYFNENNVPFTDIDVTKDRTKAQEMIMKSGQMGVPVVEVNGKVIVGFQPEVFESLLN